MAMGGRIRNRYDLETLMRLVRIAENGCWEWTGYRQSAGYGQIEIDGKRWLTHRLSWALHHDNEEPGDLILHHCDNKPCCNPAHLYEGTHADNWADAVARGRHTGDIPIEHKRKPRVRKLTHDQVKEIAASTGPLAATAERYGCSVVTVSNIRRGLR